MPGRHKYLSCAGEGLPMALAGLCDGQALLGAVSQALRTAHLRYQPLVALLNLHHAPPLCFQGEETVRSASTIIRSWPGTCNMPGKSLELQDTAFCSLSVAQIHEMLRLAARTAASSCDPTWSCEGMLCSVETAPVSTAVPCRRLLGRPNEPPASPSRDACTDEHILAWSALQVKQSVEWLFPVSGIASLQSTYVFLWKLPFCV